MRSATPGPGPRTQRRLLQQEQRQLREEQGHLRRRQMERGVDMRREIARRGVEKWVSRGLGQVEDERSASLVGIEVGGRIGRSGRSMGRSDEAQGRRQVVKGMGRRQDSSSATVISSSYGGDDGSVTTSYGTSDAYPSPTTSDGVTVSVSTSTFSSPTATTSPATGTDTNTASTTDNGLYGTSDTKSSGSGATATTPTASTTVNASSFMASWTTTQATRTATQATATASQYVPTGGAQLKNGTNGVLLNMTLNGDSVGEAVYAIPMVFGHHHDSDSERRRSLDTGKDRRRRTIGEVAILERDAAVASDYQSLMMQVDLGSSDMWVAASTCSTSSCQGSGVTKYNAGAALDSGASTNLTYQSGYATGDIYWDEVQVGVTIDEIVTAVNGTGNGGSSGFDISAQAFVAAVQVANEDLSGGDYSGLIGLALPANSVISDIIPGTYGSSPDGATFLDNLFASGTSAPSARYFTISLERSGDSRTASSFGIGTYDSFVCPSPCVPKFSSLVTSSSGPLYWRMLLQGLTITTYTNPTSTTSGWSNPSTSSITLPAAQDNVLGTTLPVAVLDSGGSEILFGDKSILDSIYSTWGVSMSSDGYYYVPCSTPMLLTFTINGVAYPVHPLDMSDYYSGTSTCFGSLQYAEGLQAGDIILGSSFLKNVYAVFAYPAADSSSSSWSPQVGLVGLTNASTAAQEFYNVRVLQESLASATAGATGSTATNGQQAAAAAAGNHVVSAGVIAAAAICGFVVLAGGLFCAWFFWLRRKHGTRGVVVPAAMYQDKMEDPATENRKSKKSIIMARQKSMIDGYSDFDTLDSWADNKTDDELMSRKASASGGEELEEISYSRESVVEGNVSASGSGSIPEPRRRTSNWESSYPPVGWVNTSSGSPSRNRNRSPSSSTSRPMQSPSTPTRILDSPGLPPDAALIDIPESRPPGPMASPSRQPLMRHEKDRSSPRRESEGSYFEMEQLGYAKQLARHAREDSTGSGTLIPVASPGLRYTSNERGGK